MGGLFGGKNTTIDNGSIASFQVNQATYGIVVPVILGTSRQSGNLIDYFNFTKIAHTSTQRTGKGGGSKTTTVDYTYKAAVLIALSEGQISGVGKVWIDTDTITTLADAGLTLFDGAIGQSPWSYVQSIQPDRALPYSGLAYVAGYIDLNSSGGVQQYNFEIQGLLRDSGDGVDINPDDAIKYILLNPNNGMGFTINNIHTVSADNFKTFCQASDMFVTVPLNDQDEAYKIINTLCEMTNTIVFWSQSKIKFVPRCQEDITGNGVTYTPNTTPEYDLDADDFLEDDEGKLVTWERTDNAETYNQATVSFTNRSNSYESEDADYQILADANKRGLRAMPSVSYPYIHTKARAEYVAQRLAMDSCYSRNTYKFKLGWAHCRLEPGDLVTLTDVATNLVKLPVMIENITESADGELECEAKYVPLGTYSPARYETYASERAQIDRYIEPGSVNTPVVFDAPAEITNTGLETWIALSGGDNWGGCEVWASEDGNAYKSIGKIEGPSRHGLLTADLPVGGITDTINALAINLLSGELLSGTQVDAENLNTLCWVDGELLAYQTATLTSSKNYRLSNLVRGAKNTAITRHAVGTQFARLDDAIFKYQFDKTDIGKRIYLKFTSYNTFGMSEQSLADVEAYEHTITLQEPPNVSDIQLNENTSILKDGTALTDILVNFAEPSYTILDHYNVYYDENNSGQWTYSGPAQPGSNGYRIKALKQAQSVKVKVTTVNKFTAESNGTVSNAYTITGKSDPPPNVAGLVLNQDEYNRANIVLIWTPLDQVTTPDLKGYEARLGSDWSTATKINSDTMVGNTFSHAVSQNGSYNFLVKAIDNSGNYSDNAISQSITVNVVPDAITNLSASQEPQDRSKLKISFMASLGKDIAGYEIRHGDAWDTGIEITTNTKEITYDWSIPASGTYNIMVRAKTVAGYYSNVSNLSVSPTIEPYDVTGFAATQSTSDRTKVTLSWDNPISKDVSYFIIKKGATWDSGIVINQRATGTFYETIVTDETEQTFWIKAVSVAGNESQNAVSVGNIFNMNPSPVSNIQIQQNSNDKSVLNIMWNGISESDLTGYDVRIGQVWESAEALPLTQELYCTYNLTQTGNVKVMIKTVNAAGYYSDEVSQTYYATVEPLDVTGLVAYQNGETVELYWGKASESDVVAYEIREGANFDQGSLVATGVTQASYVVAIDTERTYQYWVKAINRSGHYSQNAISKAITVTNLPARNVIETFDEMLSQSGSHSNTEFGESLINFGNMGGRFSDYPSTKFSDVGGNTVLKLADYYGLKNIPATVVDIVNAECGVEIKGRTLINLLGNMGNFEVDSNSDGVADGWTASLKGATPTLETTNIKYGLKAQRITTTATDTNTTRLLQKEQISNLAVGKYYVVLVDTTTDGTSLAQLQRYTDGTISGTTSMNTTTSKTLYMKMNPTVLGTTCLLQLLNLSSLGTVGWVQFDGTRLYELTDSLAVSFGYANALALYNAIGTTLTDSQVAQMFPYVDSVQFKQGTMVTAKNKNLIPPFSQWDSINANAVINSDYSLTLNATRAYQESTIYVSLNPSTTYKYSIGTLSASSGYAFFVLRFYDVNGNQISVSEIDTGTNSRQITTPSNLYKTKIGIGNSVAGTFTFTNPMLTLATAEQTFEPQAKSMAHTAIPLATGESVYITPSQSIYRKTWEKNVVLDGSLGWLFHVYSTGVTRVKIPLSPIGVMGDTALLIDNNGTIYDYDANGIAVSSYTIVAAANYIYINIPIAMTGFPAGYVAPSADIKAYFYGWKMCASDGSTYVSGTKYWKKITDGTGITSVCPTASYDGYTPYKLSYQLATPVTHINYINNDLAQPIMSPGSTLALPQGVAQIEQKTGINWATKADLANKYASTVDVGTAVGNPTIASYPYVQQFTDDSCGYYSFSDIVQLVSNVASFKATYTYGDLGDFAVYHDDTFEQIKKYYYASGTYSCSQIDIGQIITANITAQFISTVILKGAGSAVLQLRTSQDGSQWTDWQDFKPVQYTFRYAEFRVLLGTTDTTKTPEVNQFVIKVDVPDTDIAKTTTIASGGTTVDYGHTFYVIPIVTPMAIGEGLHAEIVSKTNTNCVLKIKNESNTDVGGQADVRIKGY